MELLGRQVADGDAHELRDWLRDDRGAIFWQFVLQNAQDAHARSVQKPRQFYEAGPIGQKRIVPYEHVQREQNDCLAQESAFLGVLDLRQTLNELIGPDQGEKKVP